MEIKTFEWFENREKGKPCLVAGTAPTMKDFPYETFKGIYITCGDGPERMRSVLNIEPKYWLNANTEYPIPEEHADIINSFDKTVFIFADSVAYAYREIDISFLKRNLKVDWFAYDQRHFELKECAQKKELNLKCCKVLDLYPGRETLQEYIQKRYNRGGHYSTASTVAIHALAFSIIMGCSPIYLQGIEIPEYQDQYIHAENKKKSKKKDTSRADNNAKKITIKKFFSPQSWRNLFIKIFIKLKLIDCFNFMRRKSVFFEDIPQILKDFEYLVEVALDNGLEIYCCSKTSTLNKIERLKYKDPNSL